MTNPITILLVEDDEGHSRLIRKNLSRSGFTNEVVPITNGQEALDFLFAEGKYQGQKFSRPLLILLDLNMPGLSGLQVLERIKSDERTRRIPVIILTTTDDQREISRCYELGCNLYVTKPVRYEDFAAAIRELGLLLTIVTVPNVD